MAARQFAALRSLSVFPTMRTSILVLSCSVCVFNGQPTPSSLERERSPATEERFTSNPARAFASLLFGAQPASNPAAAFSFFDGAMRSPASNLHTARAYKEHVGQRSALSRICAKYGSVVLDDGTVPPGMPVPPKDTVLRNLQVCKVMPTGIYVSVDPTSGLLGFLGQVALDNGFVKSPMDTFRIGDAIDAKVVALSKINGRLLLSRRMIMDEEGPENHILPEDGRELPTYGEHKEKKKRVARDADLTDPAVPRRGAVPPKKETVLRNLPVVKVTQEGVWCMIDEAQDLQGFMFPFGVDSHPVDNVVNTFKVGDRLDAMAVGISHVNGRFCLSRKLLMDEEGWEKHELPDDGRVRPVRIPMKRAY